MRKTHYRQSAEKEENWVSTTTAETHPQREMESKEREGEERESEGGR